MNLKFSNMNRIKKIKYTKEITKSKLRKEAINWLLIPCSICLYGLNYIRSNANA